MGPSLPSLISTIDLKGTCGSSTGSNWTKFLALQAMKRRLNRKPKVQRRRRRILLESSRRPMSGVERRIIALQRLVPNGESMGLDALFKEAADYILCLEMQAKIMQVLVKVLSDPDQEQSVISVSPECSFEV